MQHMKITGFILFFFMLTTVSFAKDKSVKNAWFQNQHCNRLEIKKPKSISEHEIIRSVTIEVASAIAGLMQRISKIPADGNMMVSFGPKAEEIDLEFHCGNEIQTIEIYGKRFKTPSTGFNSDHSEIEESLYRDIDALLFPDFNKSMLIIKNTALPYQGFSVTYTGSVTKGDAPVTAHFTQHNFVITDQNKNSQHIVVISGQRPPQPQVIEVNRKKITLLTYETSNGVRLYPDYFQITH